MTITAARIERRALSRSAVVVGLLGLLLVVVVASLMWGARDVAAAEVWRALVDPVAGNNDHAVVRDERLPRTVIGLIGGAALGAAGALMQGVTRNPIADPGLLGLNSGASLGVITAIAGFGVSTVQGYLWFAFLGAAVAAVVVYGASSLGWEGVTPVKLALVGAAFSATATSLITIVLLSDANTLDEFRFWQVGSLANRTTTFFTTVVPFVLPFVVVGLLLALASGRVLNALSLGDDVARSLGQDVARGRLLVVLAVVVLCGSAVSLVGPIAFVGLVVPHVARLLTGPDYRWIVALSMLLGPVVLLVADVVGRLLVPGELEAGLVVAVIGAPVLLLIVRQSKAVAS
ncbi:iron chelate uptake ABC transporter family permease subunit [Nocardioides marinquilinus]|uniref:Iron chelate uptake ABC transporter family permease subunit n=1 Tax=Nocardioides marinquilinus TaxID=1210400 RepID=A0ABP9PT92_9ACTN